MPEILLVSKPVVPPWTDSSKNLVRDLAGALQPPLRPHVMVPRGQRTGASGLGPGVWEEPVYGPAQGRYAPALVDNLRVLRRLALGGRHALWHFFFAPNPRSSAAGRAVSTIRRVPTVQTVCSVPRPDVDPASVLFADRVVVLSRHTERRVIDAGIDASRVRHIAPCITPPPGGEGGSAGARRRLGLPASAALLVYPGDLEFGGGAGRCVDLLSALPEELGACLVLACRAKTPAARERLQALRREVARRGLGERVRFFGETPDIHLLLEAADVVLLPSETTYAKMDLPLVLIEAMALSRPVVVATGTPAEELAEGDAALACAPAVEPLRATVEGLLDDAGARSALGARAYAAVQTRYLPGPMAAAHAALYRDLLG